MKKILITCILLVLLFACMEVAMAFELFSSAFENGGEIPVKYTCQGADVSPPLLWRDIPKGAKSLALIVDDPDAPDPANPRMIWVHWVLFNIPPELDVLKEGVSVDDLPSQVREGLNDWKRTGYGGPCPPIGRHRYFFKLYALDTVLSGLHEPTKARLEQAIQGHVLSKAVLMGTYQKR